MNDANIQTEIDRDGILLARIDMPDRGMNVFSRAMMDSLESLVERAEGNSSIKAVVLTSAKSSFLAGADLAMIKNFTEVARTGSTEELHTLFGHLGRLFRRLELSSKPFVAAINGLALGGGLEVCMACHERVVADNNDIQLGLPEVNLGLLPGAGGTQRLPRLVGTAKGLEMLLKGAPVSPEEALTIGLVHEVVAADQLIDAAKRRARAISKPASPWDKPSALFDDAPFHFDTASAFDDIAKAVGISDHKRRYYPAYHAIMDCVVGGWNLPMTEASTREMDIFVELMRDPVAGNMVRTLFLNRQKAAKLGLLKPDSPLASTPDALLPQMSDSADAAKSANCDEKEKLLALSLRALRVWLNGKVEQPDLADVAAVSAGIFPSYAGGPFTHLVWLGFAQMKQDAAAAASKGAALFSVPESAERFFQQPAR